MTKRKTATTYNYNKTLLDYMGGWNYTAKEGEEVGIEIEVEGTGLPRDNIKGWRIVEDGSLRGESAEYVFRGPATRDDVWTRLQAFDKAMAGVQVNQSYRTSVHVHLNAQNMAIKHIYSQIILYTIFEDVLAELCGKERIGNLFTLRAKDAEYYLTRILEAIRQDYLNILNDVNLRYTAVNPLALFQHGTLEFRSMRGTTDVQVIRDWAEILLALKDAAINVFENPVQIVQEVSARGPDGFANMIFSPQQIGSFPQGWQDMVTEGCRLVQHIAHASDWAETPKAKERAAKPPTYSRYTTNAATTQAQVAFNEGVDAGREEGWPQFRPIEPAGRATTAGTLARRAEVEAARIREFEALRQRLNQAIAPPNEPAPQWVNNEQEL